jgi:alpha-ketoglutarate-dependent taurine dioxygenase
MSYAITPLSEQTGAEVRGIDLARPVDDATRARLNEAFVERSVLVLRDQHLTPHQLLAAVGLFGEVFPQHNSRFALPECPLIHYISNQDFFPDGRRYIPGEGYHTDHSNAPCPPKATVLHAVSLPDRGGDTQYVNMQIAYDELPEATKRRPIYSSTRPSRNTSTATNGSRATSSCGTTARCCIRPMAITT